MSSRGGSGAVVGRNPSSRRDIPGVMSAGRGNHGNRDPAEATMIQIQEQSAAVSSPAGTTVSSAEIRLWGVRVDQMSPTARLFLLSAGVFFFYLMYGYFQELIFRLEGFKPFGWYLTLVQFAFYTMFGLTERQITGQKLRKIPLQTYSFIAFLTVATMGLSNSSLGYLNYPTQVIFKCCKLIPVLIGSIVIQGKKYGPIDFLACSCMSVGLIFFTLADSKISPTFSLYGVTLISLALCADAVIGNVQEKAMKQHGASNSEMVLFSYGIGFVYILLGQIVSGQLISAFTFCLEYPLRTYGYAAIFSLTGYLGVNVVLALLQSFGALIAVTVTTCRKALTIILSFIFFAKPFSAQYIWSGVIVLVGIYLNVYSKNRVAMNARFMAWYQRYMLPWLQRGPAPTPTYSEAHVV